MRVAALILFFVLFAGGLLPAQEVLNKTLLKADKHYIKHRYAEAVIDYVKYLEKYPKDYYASRQTAICYNRLNDPNNAIDYWPIVVESSEATEKDYLEYGKSLLANNREPEAKKVFQFLCRSKDKSIAAWGKAYLNPTITHVDTANCKIIEVSGVNSEFSESCPFIFKEKMFNLYDPLVSGRSFKALDNLFRQSIKVSVKKDSVSFLTSLLYEKLRVLNIYGQFCFSPDGKYLYFSKALSNKELYIRSETPFYKYQLFVLDMSTLHNVVPEINAFKYNIPEYDQMHPCISADAQRLVFASNRKGSMGGQDLYICEWKNNEWTEPVNLGADLNSPGNEVFPQFTNENDLYFSSDQRPGLGGLDIFYAKPSIENGKLFETAKNALAPMNSRFDDFGLYFLKGAKSGYLSSNRKNNTDDDIYYFLSN